jgi:ribosome-associated protein
MEERGASKTQRKKEMHALQDLGAELVVLSETRLACLDLPEALLAAVREARQLKAHEARRRQLQFIGRLMRDVNPAPIRARIAAWQGTSRAHAAWLHEVEAWRERLLGDPDALSELATLHPGADLQHLRTVIRNARQETQAGKPPRHFRALFQALKALIAEPVLDEAEDR